MHSLKIPHDAWVLIGDGEKALFLRNEGDETFPHLVVARQVRHPNPPTREQGTDRPGRAAESASTRKSAYENTDWHRLEKAKFAKQLAELLYDGAHAGLYRSLVVVAPPQTLHRLREALHPEVRERIVAEIDKELTQHPLHEIERILAG